MIVLFLRLLLLKIKKVLLILNSQAILIFMIKSIQQNQNTNKISKLESLLTSLRLSLNDKDDEISSLKEEIVEFKKLVDESTESINISAKYIGELKLEIRCFCF